jgi:hypothetical protein
VTPDRHPPSWKLADLLSWMHVKPSGTAHRAEADARMTWDACAHTLDRYGDDCLTPRQQLVARFFDVRQTVASEQLRSSASGEEGKEAWESDWECDSTLSSILEGMNVKGSQQATSGSAGKSDRAGSNLDNGDDFSMDFGKIFHPIREERESQPPPRETGSSIPDL